MKTGSSRHKEKYSKVDSLVKSDLLRWRTIFAESNSEKRPHCHFERQREILNKQDSSSLSFLGMTAAKASKIILNIVELLRSRFWDGKEKSSSSRRANPEECSVLSRT